MGAQNEKRREKFIQRYNEVDSNDGKISFISLFSSLMSFNYSADLRWAIFEI